jgi:hypothetical protein
MQEPLERPTATGDRDPGTSRRPERDPAWLLVLAGWLFATTSLETWARRSAATPPDPVAPIDLQRSCARELRRLPGIGQLRAAKIVDLRWERGGETFPLGEVHGIGPKTEARVREVLRRP